MENSLEVTIYNDIKSFDEAEDILGYSRTFWLTGLYELNVGEHFEAYFDVTLN